MDINATTANTAASSGMTASTSKVGQHKAGSAADLFQMLFASFQGQLGINVAQITDGQTTITANPLLTGAAGAVVGQTVTAATNTDATTDPLAKLKNLLAKNWPQGQAAPSDAELSAMASLLMAQPGWMQQLPDATTLQGELKLVADTTGLGNLPKQATGLQSALLQMQQQLKGHDAAAVDGLALKLPDAAAAGTNVNNLTAVPGNLAKSTQPVASGPEISKPNTPANVAETAQAKPAEVTSRNENRSSPVLSFFSANQNNAAGGNHMAGGMGQDTHTSNSQSFNVAEMIKGLNSAENSKTDATSTFATKLSEENPVLGFMAVTPERQLDLITGKTSLSQASNSTLYAQMPRLQDTHPASMAMSVYLQRTAAQGKDQTFHVKMEPAELGMVSVSMKFIDGKMHASISADREETLNLLKGDSSALEGALRQAGVSTDAGSLSFNLREGGTQNQDTQKNKNSNNFANAFADNSDSSGTIQLLAMPKVLAPGRVDRAF